MSRRYSAKVDNNQAEIVQALRRYGFSVVVGHDDILVGYQNQTFWYEIKQTDMISKKTGEPYEKAIKPSQRQLLNSYRGHYKIVWTVQQIIDDIRSQNPWT